MPEVPELDWSKLKPKSAEIRKPHKVYKQFKVKKVHRPKKKRAKIIDKRLFNDIYDQDQHLRSII